MFQWRAVQRGMLWRENAKTMNRENGAAETLVENQQNGVEKAALLRLRSDGMEK